MNNTVSEQLQETLFELNRVEERAKKFKEENHAILTAISAMSGAGDKREVFYILLKVMEKYVTFEHALVLTRNTDTEDHFNCLVSTLEYLECNSWKGEKTFSRCVSGKTIVLYSPDHVNEFLHLKSRGISCQSALVTGATVDKSESILIFFSSKKGGFNINAREIVEHFHPLIERTMIDIDYRERLQCLVSDKTQELAASRQRFRDFAKTASDWFWELDKTHTFTYLSSPNGSPDKFKSKKIVVYLKKQHDLINKLLRLIKSEQAFSEIEFKINRKKEERWISLSGRPFYDKKCLFLGFRGTAKDITFSKKRLQELQDARKQAELANASKSRFLAMMSHEIRTPLSGVMGLLDIISSSPLNQEQKMWVQHMDKSSNLLLTIINDILDLSRIESNHFELHFENIHPREHITFVYHQLHGVCAKKNIDLSIYIDDNVPDVIYQDGNRFTQILLNLVGNAAKFTEFGMINVSMIMNENMLNIKIEDTGIGIHEGNEDTIFDPFTQADSSITRKYAGTGLGLSICKKLVLLMNGNISFKSKINVGTVFTVNIPIIEKIKLEEPKNTFIEMTEANSLSILVAEDSKTNQMVIKLMLERGGHSVVAVNNGQEVLNIIEERAHHFDLILMDMSMPILSGIEATKRLRAQGSKIPIMALTANANNEDKQRCINAGMFDFITKPIRSSRLNLVLSQVINKIKNKEI